MEEIKKQIADLTTIVMSGRKDVEDLTTMVMNGQKDLANLTTIVMSGRKDIEDLTTIVMSGQKDLADLTNLVTTGFQDLYTHLDNIENNMDSGFSYLKGEVRDLRADIKSLQETNIPHAEYEEIRQRLLRIEDKLGLPHELSTT